MAQPTPVSGSKRLPVTLLSVGERSAAVLDAYFSGPGRSIYAPTPEDSALVAIADFDVPESLAHLKRFQEQSDCPVIVLAMADPMLPGTVWVAKPASPNKLQAAAQTVHQMLQELASAESPAEVPAEVPPPPSTPAQPEAAEEPVALSSPPRSTESLYALHPHDPRPGHRSRMPLWVGGVSLVSIAVIGFMLMRPAGNSTAAIKDAGATAATNRIAPELQSAVASSLQDSQTQSEGDKAFVEAQRAQLASKQAQEDVKAKLDRLAADPAALAEDNRSVMNKVHVTGAGAVAAPERSVRNEIESILSQASAASAVSADRFATSLQPEAKQHEAETRTIVVQQGDTLSSIALRAYGDQAKYPRIFEANPRILTSPNHIFPGQVLRVPNT